MKNPARIALIMLTIGLLSACNTVEGVGTDIAGASNMVRGWFN